MREQEAEVRRLAESFEAAGTLEDFLARAEEEAAYSEIRGALAEGVKKTRRRRRLTQQDLADLIGSSQPRVSLMEAADASVSVNLLIRTLLRLGARRKEIATILASAAIVAAVV